jgi:uncharacterized BrkB/YihY/UPF0761 family membrane protein
VPGAGGRERKRWGRIALIGVVVGAWVILSALMALDVPDLLRSRYTLPWLDDRPWWSEILNAVGMVAVGTAVLTVIFGLVLRARRGFSAGFFAGIAVGFLGLPMIASLVGAAGYFVLEKLAARFVGD